MWGVWKIRANSRGATKGRQKFNFGLDRGNHPAERKQIPRGEAKKDTNVGPLLQGTR